MNSLSSMSILCQPSSGSFETCVVVVWEQQLSAYKPVYFLFCNFRRVFQNNRAGAGGGKNITSHLLENWWSHECRDRHADIWTNISSHIPWNVRQIFHEHQISHLTKIKYHDILQQTVNVVLWKISQLLPMNSWLFLFSTIHRHHRNQCHEKYHFQAVIQILSTSITNIKSAFYLVDFNG